MACVYMPLKVGSPISVLCFLPVEWAIVLFSHICRPHISSSEKYFRIILIFTWSREPFL